MTLEVGESAPEFVLPNQHGESIALSGYRGRRHVVVVFYPYAFSSVCTRELHEIRNTIDDLADAGAEVLAVSCDPMFSLRAFSDRDGLDFALLSDFWPHGAVASSYGVFNDRLGCASRATFIVDREGTLQWYLKNEMPQARNVDDYRKVLASLD